jgi:imidazolonepropionase-like amidohydrolase
VSSSENPAIKTLYFKGNIGVIEDGAYADLILVEDNPLKDLAVLRDHENKIDLIMKDGKIYKNSL